MPLFRSLRDMVSPSYDHPLQMPRSLAAPQDHGAVAIRLRPITADDGEEWARVHRENDAWLAPWESGDPMHGAGITFKQWLQRQRYEEERGVAAVFLIEYRMRIVGQISLGAITYGALRSGVAGYWVAQDVAGHGIAPTALALLADWAMLSIDGPRLHRIEIAMLPENERSRHVVEKLQAHYEGLHPRYMFVNGRWRDHNTYSLLAEDARDGFVERLLIRHARK